MKKEKKSDLIYLVLIIIGIVSGLLIMTNAINWDKAHYINNYGGK